VNNLVSAAENRLAALGFSQDSARTSMWETLTIGSCLLAALSWSFMASSGPIQWMDNGWFMLTASQGVFFRDVVDATFHPLYEAVIVFLFNLFGGYAVAYLNSFLMLPIAYVTYRLGQTLGLSRHDAAIAALGVVLLHNVFWVSTKIEVYALHLLLVLTAYWIVFDEEVMAKQPFKIFAVGVLTGFAAATHQLTFIVLFPLYIYLWQREGWRIVLTIPGFLLGMFPAYPGLLNKLMSGGDLFTLIRVSLTGSDGTSIAGWEGALFRFDKMLDEKKYLALALVSLCGIGILGLIQIPKGPKQLTLWCAATFNLLFSVSYSLSDRFTFFLPGAAFYTVLGVAFVWKNYSRHRFTTYATLAFVVAHPLVLIGTAVLANMSFINLPAHSATLPYRNDVQYYLSPYIPDRSAEAFVLAYEQYVPQGSVVMSDFTAWSALRSAQVIGHFLHRELVQCDGERLAWPNTMYLVRKEYCGKFIQDYRIEQAPLGWILLRE
jgi:hypothetical protein